MEVLRSATEWFRIDSPSAAGSVRRASLRLANQLGFPEARAGEVAIVATEITSNVWQHAKDGAVALQTVLRGDRAGVRVIGIDRGPGMADLRRSAVDGHSSRGTLGVGIGAIERLSTSVNVSSTPGAGTVVVANLWPDAVPDAGGPDLAALTRPIHGEQVCGDTVGGHELDGHFVVMVADGLGHGPLAEAASAAALRAFRETPSTDPGALLRAMHAQLAGTRGAAVAVASIDSAYRRMSFAGIGNVSAFIDDGVRRRGAMSQPGIVGHNAGPARVLDFELSEHAVIVMHTDGLREGFNLRGVPGLLARPAAVIAATVLRDAGSRPDDACVLVGRSPR